MKTCTKCGQPGEFGKNRTRKDGLRSECKACEKAYREANREKERERNKAWREANREKRSEYQKVYHEANREKHTGQMRVWRESNSEKHANFNKAWKKANREKVRGYSHMRRARKAGATGHFTTEQWLARLAYHGWKCYYCGNNSGCMTIDHRIPLCRGGSNWPANLVPACRSCNSSKGNKTEFEFLSRKR